MDKVFSLKNVNFSYEKNKNVFDNISLDIFAEEITALIGDNGSGKTTLGKLMLGMLKPNDGLIKILGKDSTLLNLGEIGKDIGYLYQNPGKQLFTTSVSEELAFVLNFKGCEKEYIEKKVNDTLELFHLTHLKDEIPFFLSGGEKQRLAIASILINKPRYIVLDEPTTSLDIERKDILSNILEKLKDDKIGVLIISHDKPFVNRHSDRVIELSKGEIKNDIRS